MAKFIKRVTEPAYDAPEWRHTSVGGMNSCIHIKNGSVLPNCVGYAWGRWCELLGYVPSLARTNAETWFNHCDGYGRGSVPKLGAVMVWKKGKTLLGKDGAGHVAIVEEIYSDNSVLVSASDYSGKRFYTKKLKYPYKLGKSYTFLGFIYLPITYDSVEEQKYKIGTRIKINGPIYGNSYSTTPANTLKNYETIITRYNPKGNHKYNGFNDIGWFDESSIVIIDSNKKVEVGDKVRVKSIYDYDGTKCFQLVLKRTYDVYEVYGDRVVIGLNGKITGAWKMEDLEVL